VGVRGGGGEVQLRTRTKMEAMQPQQTWECLLDGCLNLHGACSTLDVIVKAGPTGALIKFLHVVDL
jgi:hypothetical protein